MKNVLIDTSAWIDYFRNSSGFIGDMVTDLIQDDKAFMTGPVIAELLHGVRGKKEAGELNLLFQTIPCLNVEQSDWISTGKKLQALRSKGLSIPLTDALIATVAIRHKMLVLTLDKHFTHLSVECLMKKRKHSPRIKRG